MNSEKEHFHRLKVQIVKKLLKSYPSTNSILKDWKGKDIQNFQSDLEKTVKGRISEKWIYTHLKNNGDKLPRKDMLDMLSEYTGTQDWDTFIKNQEVVVKNQYSLKVKTITAAAISIAVLALAIFLYPKETACKLCFVDMERQVLLLNSPIQFHLLKQEESPILIELDNHACVQFNTKDQRIRFVIKSPYYKSDTMVRSLENTKHSFEEKIQLKTNDYALMIHVFSSSKIQDWEKRRDQLNTMIHDNAQIYQIFEDGNVIMDLYNKWDFINKLTTPTRSLKNIQITETQYYNDRIQVMRFKQLDKQN